MMDPDKKRNCKDNLKAFYGLPPYVGHPSNGSGYFYVWLMRKYGKELIEECEKELKNENSNVSTRHDKSLE